MAVSIYNSTATLTASDFKGLHQGGDGVNTSLSYAASGSNFDTPAGALTNKLGGTALAGTLTGTIGTLAALYRRFYAGEGNETLFVAASGTKLYARELNAAGWTQILDGITSDKFDFVSYEVNTFYYDNANNVRITKEQYEGAGIGDDFSVVTAEAPIDVLLLSNASDGMYCVYGDSLEVIKVTVQPSGAASEVKFGVIARHAERIWGGAIPGDPDKLMYSAPYDPFDWEPNTEIPEDGAGDVQQPSWDGDSFIALRPFGSQLLAFKHNRIWRIIGQSPDTYIFKEQYGGGTINEDTVAVSNEYVLMLGYDGIYVYDGTAVSRFKHQAVSELMKTVNWSAISRACAEMNGDVYTLALPCGTNQTTNNTLLEYHVTDRSFTVRTLDARTFLAMNNVLYFTSESQPGKVTKLSGGAGLPFTWVSAWQDLGAQNCTKSAFEVYVTCTAAITLNVTIRTEKGYKTKSVSLAANKTKAVRLNAKGRRFRLELATTATAQFMLLGGVQISMELDWD